MGGNLWSKVHWKHKALTTALMVFSTTFGTALFGILIDQGFLIENIALISGSYIVISLALLLAYEKTRASKGIK